MPNMSCYELASLIISGLLAGGTFSLAYFAFRQTKHTKEEYEIRQLNDILEWTNNVIGWKYSIAVREMPSLNAHQLYRNYVSMLSRDEEQLSSISRQGKTISNIALALKKKPLVEKINSLNEEKISMTLKELKTLINRIVSNYGFIPRGFEPPDLSKLEELQKAQNKLAKEIGVEVTGIICA